MMKTKTLTPLALAAALLLPAGTAMAESQYGYSSTGTGTVSATARVNLSVTVPKLILLRVGSANAVLDTATWTSSASIPAVPTAAVDGNSQFVNWSGAAPTLSATPTGSSNVLQVNAWSNTGTSTINCAMGAWSATGGPTNADFTVTAGGAAPLPHPGGDLGACASTAFTANTLYNGTWTYTLGGSPASWTGGVYTNTVTYTAAGV